MNASSRPAFAMLCPRNGDKRFARSSRSVDRARSTMPDQRNPESRETQCVQSHSCRAVLLTATTSPQPLNPLGLRHTRKISRESIFPKLVSKGSMQRQTNQTHLHAVDLDGRERASLVVSMILEEPCMAGRKIAQPFALCNRCCMRIDMMQRTMLYSRAQSDLTTN